MNDVSAAPAFDVCVIGGGPAGMMAAGRAAELGARVVLLEKNPGPGAKLLITGGGRCNILNAERDVHRLTEKYGKKGKALFSALSQLDVEATIAFFESRGLPLKVEAENRAFPVSEKAADVHATMLEYMADHGVTVRTRAAVRGLEAENGKVVRALTDGGPVEARAFILATGGKSHPETGSTGEGFGWLRELGHTVIEPEPTLVPVALHDKWVSGLAGISLQGVKLSILLDGKPAEGRTGKLLFTHTGISGPLALGMSKRVGEELKKGGVTLSLDLFPKLDPGAMDRVLLDLFAQGKNKLLRNHVGDLAQPRLAHAVLAIAGIDAEKEVNKISREERIAFAAMLKGIPLKVSGLHGVDKAIVTGGGVSLNEVDFRTMRSKLLPNLHLAGDVLDFDRPSGGFSLQICWSTGYAAGTHAADAFAAS